MPRRTQVAEQRLERVLGLPPREARRVVAEVLDCFDCDVSEYVEERHRELKSAGAPNESIYIRIANELREERFVAPRLTVRQIRRRIYG